MARCAQLDPGADRREKQQAGPRNGHRLRATEWCPEVDRASGHTSDSARRRAPNRDESGGCPSVLNPTAHLTYPTSALAFQCPPAVVGSGASGGSLLARLPPAPRKGKMEGA